MATNFYEYINPIELPVVLDCTYNGKIPTTGRYRRLIANMKEGMFSREKLREIFIREWENILNGKYNVEQTALKNGISSYVTVIINGETLASKCLPYFEFNMNASCSFAYSHYERERYGAGISTLPKIPSIHIIKDLNEAFDPELRVAIRKALAKRGKKSASKVITIHGDKDRTIRYKFNYDHITDVKRNGTFSVPFCDEILRFNNAAIRFEAVLSELQAAFEMEEKLEGTFCFNDL